MKPNLKMQHLEQGEHENDELWAISYGDMITLLLSFFVIFFSTDFKKNKQEQVDSHFMKNFKAIEFEQVRKNILMNSSKSPDNGQSDIPNLKLLKNATITKIGDRLLVTFDSMNFYDTASETPNKNGEEVLKAFAYKFLPYTSLYKIDIKAFTDQRPVKGQHRFKDNIELSALRSIGAVRILQKAGIPLNRLEIAGYGEMDRLQSLLSPEKIQKLSLSEKQDISRTLVIIIKPDSEQSVL